MNAVLFDLWNTLIRPGSKKFTDCMAEAMEIDPDYVMDYLRASSSRHSNVPYKRIVQEVWNYHRGRGITSEIMRRVEQAHDQFVKSAEFIDGAPELLSALKGAGFYVAIVSNATSVSSTVVDRLELRNMVDDIFLSCGTGYLKPDPRAFLVPARVQGLHPEDCCVVGDKLTTDILGARLAGMAAIWFAPKVNVARADLCVDLLAIATNLADVERRLLSVRRLA